MTDGTMTVTEAANTLGLSRQLIHAWCKKGKLIATQGAGNRAAWRIDRASVESMQNSDDLARAHKHRALLVGRPKRRATPTVA
jgi:excisionase family DNA binding protein